MFRTAVNGYSVNASGADTRWLVLGLIAAMAFNIAWIAEPRSAATRADEFHEKTPAFFTLEAPLLALGVILVLRTLAAATVTAFGQVDRRGPARPPSCR